MSKHKLYLVFATVMVCILSFTAPAFAWIHGQFTANTSACAGCHVAHTAEAAKLLKVGPTQIQFCYLCHGQGGPGAPYDIQFGKTIAGGSYYSSTAGGFEKQWVGPGPNDYKDVTSRHNVAGLSGESGSVIDETYKVFTIPGGSNPLTGGNGFVCSSCHNPHAGGKTPDGNGYISGNPRLLRTSLLGQTVNTVTFKMQTVDPFVYGGLSSDVFRVIEYKQGSTAWCGACHDRFKTSNHDSFPDPGEGHANFYLGMWRHPMDAHVLPPPGFDGTIETGTPTEKPGSIKHVACFTCHRAHSTTVSATGQASIWPRDGGGTSNTSALLRMDNRGVCYNCHGAGEYNCWSDNRLVPAGSGGYIPMDCSKCHPSSTHFSGGGYACSVCHG